MGEREGGFYWVKGPILILFWRGGGVEVAMKGERLAPP